METPVVAVLRGGIGVTFLAYGAVRASGGAGGVSPVVLPLVLVVASGGVSAVYLYRRHRAIGTP